jgi:dienelactone hydrolase
MRLFAVLNATALLLASPLQAQTFANATRWQIWGTAHAHVAVAGAPSDGAFSVSAPRVEDVAIASDPGVVLAATLRTPSGSRRHPAVLLLAGGGAWPRGGYGQLKERLLAHGIATLDYDKRGVGQSTGTFLDTNEVMAQDAAAAVRWLLTRPDIDPARIAVLGLSQGGVVGPMVAAVDHRIAAVVALAGPAGRARDMFMDEMALKLPALGMRGAALTRVLAAGRRFMDAQADGTAVAPAREGLRDELLAVPLGPAIVDGVLATLQSPVTLSQYQLDASANLAAIRAPVLALYAGSDEMVNTQRSLPAARLALKANPDATIREMPGLTHIFARMDGGKPGPEALSDPATLDIVTDWLRQHL